MTSDRPVLQEPTRVFVWVWLPASDQPVACGRLDDRDGRVTFTYARSFLQRQDALALYGPELPLQPGPQFATSGTRLPLCIDDAMPDAWGRRLVNLRLAMANVELREFTYLLASGSDRIGALDFQDAPDVYVPRGVATPTLDDLASAAAMVEAGEALNPQLEAALLRGTSIGGARPKALLDDHERGVIAKFSSTTDAFPVVQGEFVAMELARRAGLSVAPVSLVRAAGRYALLVERFDRTSRGHRRHLVSALTILGLTPFPEGRYATYADLADRIREGFVESDATLRELFGRVAFNILCGNTDDHGRNHAAFVEPAGCVLTPAYDICPQGRTGRSAYQAMAYGPRGEREARLGLLLAAAPVYHLTASEAQDIVDHQVATINDNWDEVCEQGELTASQRRGFLHRQFLNPSVFE